MLTILDARAESIVPQYLATVLPNEVARDDVTLRVPMSDYCHAAPDAVRCAVWYQSIELVPGMSLPGVNGMNFNAAVHPVDIPHDETSMLQHRLGLSRNPGHDASVRARLNLQNLIPSAPVVKVDLGPALHVEELILQIAMPTSISFSQLRLDEWIWNEISHVRPWCGEPIHHLDIYTDGSKLRNGKVGAAVIAIAYTDYGYMHVCTLAQSVPDLHAFHGEHAAITWAVLWAIQQVTFQHRCQTHCMTVRFLFDCASSGYQVAGWWQSPRNPKWQRLLRSLGQMLENACGWANVTYQHTYAHQGCLWNEVADAAAKYAAHELEPCIPESKEWIHNDDILCACQWVWSLPHFRQGDPSLPVFDGQFLQHRLESQVSPPVPANDQVWCTQHGVSDVPSNSLRHGVLRVATANVMSLLEDQQQAQSIVGARQLSLMQQFAEAEFHVVTVQETRHKKISQNNEFFHAFGRPSQNGHEGIQVWISKTLALHPTLAPFSRADVKVVFASPNAMILKISRDGLRIALVAAHAPHGDHDSHTQANFWQQLSRILRDKCQGWFVLFAGDANAHLGSEQSQAVGDYGAVTENSAGFVFHQWMLDHALYAPSTFELCHYGSHDTFYSVRNQVGHRLDYVAVPQDVPHDSVKTWVVDSIDLGISRLDHLALGCHIQLSWKGLEPTKVHKTSRLDGGHVVEWLQTAQGQQDLYDALVLPRWNFDVHRHADLLAGQTALAVPRKYKPTQSFRKRHLQEETQLLVRAKQVAFPEWKQIRHQYHQGLCFAVFAAWKTCKQPPEQHQHHKPLVPNPLWPALAQGEFQLRKLSLAATTAIRKDDADFLTSLAVRAGESYHAEGLAGLWKCIKYVLPKHAQKRHQPTVDMGNALRGHFAKLEAGSETTWQELTDQCYSRQARMIEAAPAERLIPLQDLPTLSEIEFHCQQQGVRKAPGPDGICGEICHHGPTAVAPALHNLMLKSYLNSVEPAPFKGGILHALYKGSGSLDDPTKYRGGVVVDSCLPINRQPARVSMVDFRVSKPAQLFTFCGFTPSVART